MEQYEVRPYKSGGWVIVEINSGREIILFNGRETAEEACRVLNAGEE
jgi:hypothetical protein